MPNHPDSSAHIRFQEEMQNRARVKVVSVGGGGNNAINRMIDAGMEGVEFISINTDLQSLQDSKAHVRLQLGTRLTRGLSAGANPEVGRRAALEDVDAIAQALEGADMVFITAGMGGGTGTGAAPIIAALASQMGALTVAIVTRPFAFEGKRRMNQAERGLQELLDHVDTLIVIPNEKLLAAAKNAGFFESFQIADDVLQQAVRGISDIITVPGVINRDLADVKATMAGMGYGVMGTASRTGPHRAAEAALAAITSPLLEAGAIDGARGILINITGSQSLKLSEVYEASSIIQEAAHEDANIIFGAVLDEQLGDEVKITVIATGFHQESRGRKRLSSAQPPTEIEEAPEPDLDAATQAFDSNLEQMVQSPFEPVESPLPDAISEDAIPVTPEPRQQYPREIDLEQVRFTNTEYAASDEIANFEEDIEPKQSVGLFQDAEPIMYEEEDLLAYIEGPPFALTEATEEALSLEEEEPPAQPEIARLRQAAMAAYTAVSTFEFEEESEEPEFLVARSFAEILANRHGVDPLHQMEPDFILDDDEAAIASEAVMGTPHPPIGSADSRDQTEDEYPAELAAQDTQPLFPETPAITAESPSVPGFLPSFTFNSPAPPVYKSTSLPVETKAITTPGDADVKRPIRDFNRRLNRDPDFFPGQEANEVRSDIQTRVPSFAVAHDPEEVSAEFDELEIPAFLRGALRRK